MSDKVIRISRDVFQALEKHGKFGETPDDVLRRLLRLPEKQKPEPMFSAGKRAAGFKKLPRQASQIVEILVKLKKPVPRSELLRHMANEIETTQPIDRILAFYKKRLREERFIVESKP